MTEASRFRILGVKLSCKHCGGEVFSHRTGQLNTPGLTFLNLDWLNRSADIYVCERCGYLHWFLDASLRQGVVEAEDAEVEDISVGKDAAEPIAPEPADVDDRSTPTECLACGATIEAGKDVCETCGWTYRR